MDFRQLVYSIKSTHFQLQEKAAKAINIQLTLRNWLVGLYIVEFEQNGEDRAEYGKGIINSLSKKIKIKGLGKTNLKHCRLFYFSYPNLLKISLQKDPEIIPNSIRQSLTDELQVIDNQNFEISQSATDFSVSKNRDEISTSHQHLYQLLKTASFTHFVELIRINEQTERNFYELLILKTQASVAELKKQINSLAFERTGLSNEFPQAFEILERQIKPVQTVDVIKTHYLFDFLGLDHPKLIEESQLEQALIDHLQEFMTEMGDGYCFEARQKRILMGEEYFFIDLVFYHRILKCHVLLELKTEKARHKHIGQLKTYLEHYKRNIQEKTDNPPVGILLVTHQNKTMVEYAVADVDKEIFVSQYLLQLPQKDQLKEFITKELKKL